MTGTADDRREADGRAVYEAFYADTFHVTPWEDLADFRRERFRRLAEAFRAMFGAVAAPPTD